jgi:hypothetical protein
MTISPVASTDSDQTIINALPLFRRALDRWEKPPTFAQYHEDYGRHLTPWLKPMLEDFSQYRNIQVSAQSDPLFETLLGLDWPHYRNRSLALDPDFEMKRLQRHIAGVQKCLGVRLKGEVVLFGAFTMMDGYARFDRGSHRVYLGVDESFSERSYLDVLETHELTHVARESQAEVWEGYGLSPTLNHDGFVESQCVLEHLANEGFACVVSECLNPGLEHFRYVYQNAQSFERLLEHAPAINRRIHRALHLQESYRHLYRVDDYQAPGLPPFAHYTWAWQWMRAVVEKFGAGDPTRIVAACSKDWLAHAKAFAINATQF